jgi:hypothetical protein
MKILKVPEFVSTKDITVFFTHAIRTWQQQSGLDFFEATSNTRVVARAFR